MAALNHIGLVLLIQLSTEGVIGFLQQVSTANNRYERLVTGYRVQMGTTKIAPQIIQYTAVDACSR